jgi:hypothetical protein
MDGVGQYRRKMPRGARGVRLCAQEGLLGELCGEA